MNDLLSEDLWWMPISVERDALSIGVAHSEPIPDDADVGLLCHSVDVGGNASVNEELYDLSYVATWRARWNNQNVFRTLQLYDKLTSQPAHIGPFVLDIDRQLAGDPHGLTNAAAVAHAAFEEFVLLGASEREVHVIFSGHKGFNIEVRPEDIGLSSRTTLGSAGSWWSVTNDLIKRLRKRFGCTETVGNQITNQGTAIDHFFETRPPHALKQRHRHLRLMGSENTWIDGLGRRRSNIKRRISVDELSSPRFITSLQQT